MAGAGWTLISRFNSGPQLDPVKFVGQKRIRGLTNRQLSRQIGITEQRLSEIVHGSPASYETLVKLTNAISEAPLLPDVSLICTSAEPSGAREEVEA